LNICEPEDATQTAPTQLPEPPADTGEVATPQQLRAINRLATQRGINLDRAGVDVDDLTRAQASALIGRWQQEARAS
jgi:hypothetical protein